MVQPMKTVSGGGALAVMAIGLVLFSGCRAGVQVIPQAARPATSAAAAPMGYCIQAGAFSVLDNATRLTRSLNARGLEAYYFPDESGLYKVRFGDFPSREAAAREARRLREKAFIEDFYIVGAEDYPVLKKNLFEEAEFRENLAATAERFMGIEYSWGGTSSRVGFDCSGLARAVYQLNGLSLPRSAAEQFRAGIAVPRDKLLKGDLVFFAPSPSRAISHVGIYVGEAAFIHAPGKDKKIRKDPLDSGYFKEHFSGARTYLR